MSLFGEDINHRKCSDRNYQVYDKNSLSGFEVLYSLLGEK